jgi:UDP-N-acetylglucosamine diphosphorylase / glucose-1-phosphate thymidylyltransferase / UDP-N-acetylgalactosamine diphosphorylase / glucosamine-1-phosphate N-acetyltransferase / galactosamine-1-phosphate N-acetyltransferase
MQAIILSAGASSRFWPINGRHKSLIKIMGKPLVYWLITSLEEKGIKEVVIVQGPGKEVERELNNYNFKIPIKYVIQSEPKGTGEAILKAEKIVKGQFFVLNAERIDIKEHIDLIIDKFKKDKNKLILLAGETENPWLYGILKIKGDKVLDLVEKPEKGKEPSNLKVVGTYFLPEEFFGYLRKVPVHMYSLEEALLLYAKEKDVRVLRTDKKTFSLKYPWHLFNMKNYLFDNFLEKSIHSSVKILDSAQVKGRVFIGKNVKIFEGAVIKGPSYIGDNCIVGNNALIREYSNIEEGCLIGGFAEVTRCIFQKDTHTHSGYFGDSIFGGGCKVGAGTVTANVRIDGEEVKSVIKEKAINTRLNQLGVIVGKETRIGINVSLMPGVLIGSGCKIGPHSIVLNNIKDNTIFYTKAQSIAKKK